MGWELGWRAVLELEGRARAERRARRRAALHAHRLLFSGCGLRTSPDLSGLRFFPAGVEVRCPGRGLGPLLSGVEHRAHAAGCWGLLEELLVRSPRACPHTQRQRLDLGLATEDLDQSCLGLGAGQSGQGLRD